MIHVGFSGTREGMTAAQARALRRVLEQADPRGQLVLHHGDCIGADAQADGLAKLLRMTRVAHPPLDESRRAFRDADRVLAPLKYLARNRKIVEECHWLIICPKEMTEQAVGSGTWATKRYARKAGKPVVVIFPDGKVEWL